jgi:hypothetical protein
VRIKIFEIFFPKSTTTILAVADKMANIQAILIIGKFVSKIAFAFVTIYIASYSVNSGGCVLKYIFY